MPQHPLPTMFAPAERSTPEELLAQRERVLEIPIVRRVLDVVPDPIAILNENRQILFANRALVAFVGCPRDDTAVLGLRPGEALKCGHATTSAGGCGTTENCSMCGAVRAILAAQRGLADIQDCTILKQDGDALDLKMWATPFDFDGESYTFLVCQDLSSEKRRRALERIFFHDVLNTLGGLYGYADLMNEHEQAAEDEELKFFSQSIFQISSNVIGEIQAQKDLSAAESLELVPEYHDVDALELITEVAGMYTAHAVAKGKHVAIPPACVSTAMRTDSTMVRRIVGNLLKNALEASKEGETVTVACVDDGDQVMFSVHNVGVMPRPAQLQVFKRSFSTKGKGRGLGTYSVKLLTEKYLGGQAFFTSSEGKGTTFTARVPKLPLTE